ncbi:MAG: hypothetical protein AB7P03_17565 [Kofleriaceae bacterium]
MSEADKLGYPSAWLRFGLLDAGFLEAQLAQFSREDADPEHFRWAAFLRVLDCTEMSDELVEQFVELARLDPSPSLATSALIALVEHRSLTEEQFARLKKIVDGNESAEARYRRAEFRRRLTANRNDVNIVDDCARRGDASVQREVLGLFEPSSTALEHLKAHGKNRAIRNTAAMRLRQRRAPK